MSYLIKNTNIDDPVLGLLRAHDVLVQGTKIQAIGTKLEAPEAEQIDGRDRYVLPGFVHAVSAWGIQGPGWREDQGAELSDPISPEHEVSYAFDHDGMLFQRAFSFGVTVAGVLPTVKNILGGQAAVYKTYGLHPYQMQVADKIAMCASVGAPVTQHYKAQKAAPMTRMGIFALLRAALEKAAREPAADDFKSKALGPVLEGKMPLLVNCHKRQEIDALFHALQPYPQIRLILSGAYGLREGIAAVDRGDCPVLFGDHSMPLHDGWQRMDWAYAIQGMEEGLPFAIACGGNQPSDGRESLLWNACMYRRRGLSRAACLKAMTQTPAEILGIFDRLGSVAEGKDADLVLWTEHPLESYLATPELVLIDGQSVLEKELRRTCW